MSETAYLVLARNDGDRDEKLVGTTPSNAEALPAPRRNGKQSPT
jgi:hypothetical protein